MPQNLSAHIVSPQVWDFDEKRLHWAVVVREQDNGLNCGFAKIDCLIFFQILVKSLKSFDDI